MLEFSNFSGLSSEAFREQAIIAYLDEEYEKGEPRRNCIYEHDTFCKSATQITKSAYSYSSHHKK